VQIQKKEVERTRLDLPMPPPLKAREMQWFVVTPENIDQVWAKLKEKNVDLVVFALTDDGYQELAMTMAEVRNYIASQRAIIVKYKEYYEPNKTPDTK
jgi:predicted GTPase